jgi:hypothetical protein
MQGRDFDATLFQLRIQDRPIFSQHKSPSPSRGAHLLESHSLEREGKPDRRHRGDFQIEPQEPMR